MTDLSRREFLLGTSILGRGWSAGLRNALARLIEPHLHFPTDPRARLAVTSWPFREFIASPDNPYWNREKPGMDIKDFAGMVA